MRIECIPYHKNVLAQYKNDMYSTLIHESDISCDSMKRIEFKLQNNEPRWVEGYFAMKDKIKYFIPNQHYASLPLRVTNFDKATYKEDIVLIPVAPKGFKINPEQMYTPRQMIDLHCPFKHSNPEAFIITKIIAFMGYIGHNFTCVATTPEFGKTSTYNFIHSLTDKSPVFQPRTVPGCIRQITSTGNIVFDDISKVNKQVREILEGMNLVIGDGNPLYINGAMKAKSLKQQYDTSWQSLTYLYNVIESYTDYKQYFDFMFGNNGAINTRFLKLKFEGVLEEKFSKGINIIQSAKENRQVYINTAKTLLYLQDLRKSNGYTRRYNRSELPFKLSNRRYDSLDDITWLLDMYCESQIEFDKYYNLIIKGIKDYQEMIQPYKNEIKEDTPFSVFEENIEVE